ncbi:MAG: spermidine synthase [Candidatus Eisenbacteria bacterium]|nr:spermidine synthase [Candidatus Eisenbacteria bacterium]
MGAVGPTKLEILGYESTPLGMLCLRRREMLADPGTWVTEITLDHELLMSSYHNVSERALAEHALEMHPGSGLRVLVGGLGLGYTAAAALACERVASIEVIELLPHVIDWLERGLFPLSAELRSEPRLSVARGDVFARLATPRAGEFDLILIDVDHSPAERLGGSSSAFYTRAGLRAAKRHLVPGGVLAVWSYAEDTPFSAALREVFANVEVVPVRFRNVLVDEEETDWLFFARDSAR